LSSPSPTNGVSGVGLKTTLGWTAGAVGTTYHVACGTTNPPSTVASALTAAAYTPGTLTASTTYYWRVTAVSSGGTTAGQLWSFTTGSGSSGGANDIVLYASDMSAVAGAWTTAADASAAGGMKLTNSDLGAATVDAPL